jgi:hypothetical protein
MFGPVALTHFVYGFIVCSLVAAYVCVISMNLRQKKRLQQLERQGYRPVCNADAIIRSQQTDYDR